jgi:soluble lytic murein transglycosylase-like protein
MGFRAITEDEIAPSAGFRPISEDEIASEEPSMLDTASMYARAFTGGAADMFGAGADIANPVIRQAKINSLLNSYLGLGDQNTVNDAIASGLSAQAQWNKLSSALYGDAQPTTDEGRYGVAVAKYLPAAFVPGFGGFASAIGSGVGEEAAKDMGASPLLGAVLGGAAPGAAKAVAGSSLKGLANLLGVGNKEEAARAIALDLIGTKGAKQILDTPLNTSEFAKYMRTAEVVPDHRLAALTAAVENKATNKLLGAQGETAAEVMAKKDALRSALQQQTIANVAPVSRLPEVGGEIIRTALKEGEKNATGVVGAAYTKAFKSKPVMTLPTEISPSLAKIKLSSVVSEDAAKAADDLRFAIKKADGKIDTELFKNARQVIGEELGSFKRPLTKRAEKTAKTQLSRLYAQLKEVSKQNPALVKADALNRAKGTTFATRSNKKVLAAEDAFGNMKMLESKIPAQAVSSPEAIKQTLKAINTKSIIGQSASESLRAREVLADTLLDSVVKNSKDAAGNFTFAGFTKNFSNVMQSGKAREIFTRPQIKALSIVRNDLQSKAKYLERTRLGSAGGSQTAEKSANMSAMIIDAAKQVVYKIPIIGPGLEAGAANRIAKIESIATDQLIRALSDHSFAKDFVKLAQKDGRPVQALTERLAGVVGNATVKAVMQNKEEFMTDDKPTSADTAGLSKLIDQVVGPSEAQASAPAATPSELPRSLVNAVIHQESRGRADAVSPKGAQGLMQIMPGTARDIAKELGVTDYDLKDRETNQRFGEYYLAKQLKRFGTPELALAAYNAGPGKVQMWIEKYGPSWEAISSGIAEDIAARKLNREYYRETLNYVPSIMKRVVSV